MKKLIGLLAFLMLIGVSISNAQAKKVTGTVTDKSDGSPLPGVSVAVKGTTSGTATDINGKYTINVSPEDILVFSFVGMKAQEIKVGAKTVINVKLESSRIAVEEVVITATGLKRSEKSLGYAATSVKSDELTKTATTSVMTGLKGKVAGVQISNSSGAVGSSTKVVLRGYSSVSGNNQPLYVVDGMPIDNSTTGTGTLNDAVDFGNRAGDINPDDIESMTILKGASATALYGSRAANGVIMIVTKSGSKGKKMEININSSVDMNEPVNTPDFQNKFGQGWSGTWYSTENGSWGPKFDGKVRPYGNTVDGERLEKPFLANKDNFKDFWEKGWTYKNSVSISAGNDRGSYYASYSNVSSDGFIPSDKDKFTRNSFSIKADYDLTEKFKMSASANHIVKVSDVVAVGQGMATTGEPLMGEIYQIPRDFSYTDMKNYKDPYYDYGTYYTPYASNPYQAIGENSNHQKEQRFYGHFALEYQILPELLVKYKIGTDVANSHIKQFSAPISYKGTDNASKNDIPGGVLQRERYSSEVNSDLMFVFDKDLMEGLNLNAIAGWNVNQREESREDILVKNLDIPGFYHIKNSSSRQEGSYFSSRRRLYGVYGQIDLGYKDFLFLNMVARNDWSSTLPENDRSFFYPGVGLGFIATEAFPELKKIFSFAKIRTSWGKTGNDADPYSLENVLAKGNIFMGFGNMTFPFTNTYTGNDINSWEVSNILANANVKPEITTEIEIGADLRFLDNRINIDFAYYKKNTKDQIANIDVPASSGYTSKLTNLGEIENKGIELAVNINPIRSNDFNWNFTYTFSKNDSKVISLLPGLEKLDLAPVNALEYRAEVGKPLGTYWGESFLRDDEGNLVCSASNGLPLNDPENQYFGDSNYDFTMGFTNNLSYKNFNLSFSLDWRQGGYMYSRTAYYMLFTGNGAYTTYNNREGFVVPNSVNKLADGSFVPNTTPIPYQYIAYFWPSYTFDSSKCIDKTYVKLRDVSLSYTFPSEWFKKYYIKDLQLSFYGKNLWTWRARENKYVDPENTTFGNDLTSEYGEYAGLPSARSYGVILKVKF